MTVQAFLDSEIPVFACLLAVALVLVCLPLATVETRQALQDRAEAKRARISAARDETVHQYTPQERARMTRDFLDNHWGG